MDTVRVDISYRPLRIAWAIKSGDMEAFRSAARFSYALLGGRFNPIVVVDKPDEARSLIDVFRADVILPIGDSPEVREFPKKFPHIITPFYHDDIFVGDANYGVRSEVLDVHNALACLIHETESASLCGRFFAANEVHDGRNNVRAGAERRLGEGDGVFGTRLRRDGLR